MTAQLTPENNGPTRLVPVPARPPWRLSPCLAIPPESETPDAPKLKTTLALLMVRAGRIVQTEEIVRELWGETPPKSAMQTVQSYIMKLRRCFGGGSTAMELLRTRSRGYMLDIAPSEVDVLRFEEAHQQLRAGLPTDEQQLLHALSKLELALSLVDDCALQDVKCGSRLDLWTLEFLESYRNMQRLRFEASLRLGLHTEILPVLRQFWRADPTQEDFAGLLILALYRSTRRSEIYEVYITTRRALGELGLDMSPQLSSLHGRVLEGDARLLVAPPMLLA